MTEALTEIPPQAFSELRDLIIEKRDKLPRRLAQVAAYTIEFPDDIAFGTVGSISERAAVQPSTLVRFAQALGYSGFSELQAVFQQRLRDRPNNYEARLEALDAHTSGHSPAMAVIDGFSRAAIRSVERFKERIKPEDLDEAARILAAADTIYLIGLRRSYPITAYLSYALGTLGIKTVLAGSPSGVDREILVLRRPARRRACGQFHALRASDGGIHAPGRQPERAACRDHRQPVQPAGVEHQRLVRDRRERF